MHFNSDEEITDNVFISPSYSDDRISYLMEVERLSLSLSNLNKEISTKEIKKDKCKDLLSALKEGKVQKDLKFWHYFEDNMFVEFTRKDSVNFTEKENEKLNKEINNKKKEFEENKQKIIEIIIKNKTKVLSDINDLEPQVINLVEKDYLKRINTK